MALSVSPGVQLDRSASADNILLWAHTGGQTRGEAQRLILSNQMGKIQYISAIDTECKTAHIGGNRLPPSVHGSKVHRNSKPLQDELLTQTFALPQHEPTCGHSRRNTRQSGTCRLAGTNGRQSVQMLQGTGNVQTESGSVSGTIRRMAGWVVYIYADPVWI